MPEVSETRFLVQHEWNECKCGLNENVFNSKQMLNCGKWWCECKELDFRSSCKNGCRGNPIACNCECSKASKIVEYLDIKKCSCKKRLFSELVLAWEDEVLNTTETMVEDHSYATSIFDKKITWQK